MSHTTPQTHMDATAPHRCYVVFYYKGKRHRIYNGKPLDIICNPNHQKSLTDKKRELARLCQLVGAALRDGWYPGKEKEIIPEPIHEPTAVEELKRALLRFDRNGWALTYKRDMTRIATEYITHLNRYHPLAKLYELKPVDLAVFLDNYRSSGRYYMNKRRNLSALYKLLGLDNNPVKATPTMKVTEQLNEAYTPEQLVPILKYLQKANPNLYLCALMTYGTLLRPHQEIRLLRRCDFDQDLNFITLAGKATKNGKIRRVPVPDYVREELLNRCTQELTPSAYIFSLTDQPLNRDYFLTAWTRAKTELLTRGLLSREQTLYSFRHSAAVYAFNQHQNIKLLQGLMGHGSPDVSMKYLRSLGIMEVTSSLDLPKLSGL